jgi:hypothetical protein
MLMRPWTSPLNFWACVVLALATLWDTLFSCAEVTWVTAMTLITINAKTTTGIMASNNFVRIELTFRSETRPASIFVNVDSLSIPVAPGIGRALSNL